MSRQQEWASKSVVVLGASSNPNRYSNMAIRMLKKMGYRTLPVHPRLPEVEGLPAFSSLSQIQVHVDTLTLYIAPFRILSLINEIVALRPDRVIFNPGTECPELAAALEQAGIAFQYACTLVMLQSNQF